MMRKVVLGMMMAGLLLPGLASAQDEDHRPGGHRKWAEGRGEPPADGERRGPGEPRPQGRPQGQVQNQSQPQLQQQPDRQFGGERPMSRDGRFGGDGRWSGQRDPRNGGGRDRYGPGRSGAERGVDRPAGGRFDPNGVRPQGGPPIAPGSGGYRPQPGQFGFDRGRPGAPAYRPSPPGRGGGWSRGWRDDRHYDYRQYRTQNRFVFRLPRYQAPRGWGYGYRRFAPGLTLSPVLFDQDYWIDDPYAYRLPPAWEPYRWVRYYNDALLVDLRTGQVVDTVFDLFW